MIVLQTRTGGFYKAGIDRGRIGKAPVTAAGNIASGWRLVLMSVPLGFKTTARNWAKRKWQANSRDRHVYDTIKCFEHQLSLTSFEGMSGLYLNDGITQWNWWTFPFVDICMTWISLLVAQQKGCCALTWHASVPHNACCKQSRICEISLGQFWQEFCIGNLVFQSRGCWNAMRGEGLVIAGFEWTYSLLLI